jgi:hypothetical protein
MILTLSAGNPRKKEQEMEKERKRVYFHIE